MRNLDAELFFPDFGSEPNFEGFHASEPAGNLSGGDDSESEAVTESDDNVKSINMRSVILIINSRRSNFKHLHNKAIILQQVGNHLVY